MTDSVPLRVRANHLYVHIPFCARRCVYCDFSIAVRARVPVQEYVTALARELSTRHSDTQLRLDTLYLGGGTPSKLGAEGVRRTMDAIQKKAELTAGAEVTLEANPEDVESSSVRAWREAGINRVSLGVQSFDDRALSWMHRTHDANAARRAVQVLREGGLSNISIDLIFAMPSVVGRSWESDLHETLALDLPHVSVYGLTIEPRTPLGRWVARDDVQEEPEETFESEFLAADRALTASGLEHYEVSNYGKPGMHSRHNWAYWRRASYVGIGPSAHEFDGRVRRWNVEPYAEWESRLDRSETPTEGVEELREDQAAQETTYLGLRTTQGVSLPAGERESVKLWVESGWATLQDSFLRLTASGWLRIDAIATDLTSFGSRY